PFALDQRVGDERGTVHQVAYRLGRDIHLAQRFDKRRLDCTRGVVACRQDLAHREVTRFLVDHDQVGEGATDIDAHPIRLSHDWAFNWGNRLSGKMSTVAERCCTSIPPSTTSVWPVM